MLQGIINLFWLLSGPAAIGHDIEVLWQKGYSWIDTSFGRTISAGDLDGDGYLDIATSFAFASNGWVNSPLIFSGNPLDTIVDIRVWPEGFEGVAGVLAMDITGDGIDDLIVGSSQDSKLFVYFGPLVDSQPSDAWMDDDDLFSYDFGWSFANAGDVNGDGYEDLIVGGYYAKYIGIYGAAYIYLGGPSFTSGEHQPDIMLFGGDSHGADGYKEQFGFQVGGGGDFNDDGYDDVIVGARQYGNDAIASAGRVYIYFGGNPMDTVADVAVRGETASDYIGETPIDLLSKSEGAYSTFGSMYIDNFRGKAYVLFGGKEYDDIVDVEIWGRNDTSGLTWGGCSSAGDADHDGREDLIIGAPTERGATWDGAVYFYRGGNVIDNVYDGWLEGKNGEEPGWIVEKAGDIDGDGRSEFLVGSYASDFPKVWLCKFTGPGVEEVNEIDDVLKLELSATVTRSEVRFYYNKPLNKEATISVFDVTGALVRRYDGLKATDIVWDLKDNLGRRVSSGAYTVRLTADDSAATQRVIVVK